MLSTSDFFKNNEHFPDVKIFYGYQIMKRDKIAIKTRDQCSKNTHRNWMMVQQDLVFKGNSKGIQEKNHTEIEREW